MLYRFVSEEDIGSKTAVLPSTDIAGNTISSGVADYEPEAIIIVTGFIIIWIHFRSAYDYP